MSLGGVKALTIIVSGHACRPQSADLRPFWCGFIELQRKLPEDAVIQDIFTHSWNPELSSLIDLVYAPRLSQNQKQPYFYSEYIQSINPPDFYEEGLDRPHSTWKNVSIQTVIGNLRSRARAIAQMKYPSSKKAEGRVLMTRWDLGQTGSKQVNQMVVDLALPREYLYFANFPEVDEGYADMWILSPVELAYLFCNIDQFALECLCGKNSYLDLFTKKGWPRSKNFNQIESIYAHPITQRAHALILKTMKYITRKFNGYTLMHRGIQKILSRPLRFLELPLITAENSYIDSNASHERIFPSYQALNIHALLKFFILTKGLRKMTRFLAYDDFDTSSKSGQLIHPQAFVLFIWADVFDSKVLQRVVAESPLPIAAIYLLNELQVSEVSCKDSNELVIHHLNSASVKDCDRLKCAIDAALLKSWNGLPFLILPSLDKYLACADWFYLNALLKYIVWSDTGYVGMGDVQAGKPQIEFPDIELVRGKEAFSFLRGLGSLLEIRAMLGQSSVGLEELTLRAELMGLEFPNIVPARRLF